MLYGFNMDSQIISKLFRVSLEFLGMLMEFFFLDCYEMLEFIQ